MGKKKSSTSSVQELNVENIANIASDSIRDVIYSVLTDVITRLERENLITDVAQTIEIVDQVTSQVGIDGIRLRRANIERRLQSRKQAGSKSSSKKQISINWVTHPKDKKLEYSTDAEVARKYILRKIGTNSVVGLLDKSKLKDKKSGYGLKDEKTYTISSAEHLMLKTRGFEVEKKSSKSKLKFKKEESEEENSDEEEESEEENTREVELVDSEDEKEEENSDEEEEKTSDDEGEESDEELPIVVKKKEKKKSKKEKY